MVAATGPKYRSDFIMLSGIGWIVGYCILPWMALLFHHFRHMTLACSILLMLMALWFFLSIDESPRWQLTQNQFDKSFKMIKKILIKNNVIISDQDLKEKMEQLKSHIELVKIT